MRALWAAVWSFLSRLWLAFDARAQRQADRAALEGETRQAERTEREAERDASAEAHRDPGRGAVAGRLRDGSF